MQDLTIILGHYSLFGALAFAVWAIFASLLGAHLRSITFLAPLTAFLVALLAGPSLFETPLASVLSAALVGLVVSAGAWIAFRDLPARASSGLQRSAERAIGATAGLTLLACGCVIHGFLTDDFRLDYVYHYSSSSQAIQYKIGALWGGQAGSLLLWVTILAVMAGLMVRTNRDKSRGLMPYAVAVVGVVLAFFLILLNFIESPFATSAMRPDGVGLNPQLKNYWMMIHPPTLYLGYVGFTIPFAFCIAALITRRSGDVWFRTTRRWTLFSWFFLGTGILLGSYWAYIELGWGGYWAWDPVENASLMPWLTGTAFLHSVMIQEKKGMLKVWNVLLIILTFSLSIFGTFLTRSGIISSVHAFATSDIGPAFGTFLFLIFFGAMILLVSRLDNLRSEARLESVLSRESSFLFNNMIFVGIAATVLLLTTFPILSEAVTGRKVTMGPPIFNLVNIPWALALLLLSGIGPLIAWRKASKANLRRNFTMPALFGLWVLLAALLWGRADHWPALRELFASIAAFDVAGAFDKLKEFYPAFTFAIGAFVMATVALEFHRGVRVRRHNQGESWPTALTRLIWRNKRRFGGYIVHVGVVVVFFGIAASSAYRLETKSVLEPGGLLAFDDYLMRYEGYRLEAADDHVAAITELSLFDRRSGKPLGTVFPEQRFHPNLQIHELRDAFVEAKRRGADGAEGHQEAVAELYALIQRLEERSGREVKTPSTEVAIRSFLSPLSGTRFGEDFYVIPLWVDPRTGQANFRVFVNPLVNFLWLGGLIFVIGAHICVLPDALERKRLAGAMALEERAVA